MVVICYFFQPRIMPRSSSFARTTKDQYSIGCAWMIGYIRYYNTVALERIPIPEKMAR